MLKEIDMPNESELRAAASGQLRHVPPPTPDTHAVEQEIEKALHRIEQIDAKRIRVVFEGNRVVLRGDVKSWREHEAAAKAAAGITGVARVQNELRVAPCMF